MRHWTCTWPLVLLAFTLTAASAADRPLVGPAPDWVEPAAEEPAVPAGTDAALLILQNDQQVRIGPESTETYFDTRIRIQTPQGLQGIGTITLSWQPDNDVITVHRLSVRRDTQVRDLLGNGDGFTVLRREDMLEQATLTGELTAVLQPSDLQVGDIVEFAYTLRHADPVLPDKPSLQFAWSNSPIQAAHFRALWPKNMFVRWQARDFKPAIRESSNGSNQSIAFSLENPPPLLQPTGAPVRFTALRRMELTTFQSWAEVSRRMAPLYTQAAKLNPNSPLRAEIQRIRQASADPKARAAAALRLVQENVRYVLLAMNDGALAPATADETWQRRYGDCKAKTALLLALLRELGMDAEPVAVHTVMGGGIDRMLPGVSAFDHVLVRAQIGGTAYWLDGTRLGDRQLELLQVPSFGWGLPLTAKGSELVRIEPVPLNEPNYVQEVRLDASGGVDKPVPFHGQIVFRGDGAFSLKLSQDNLDATQRDQGMRNFWRNRFDDLQLANVAASFDEPSGAMTWTADGTLRMDWSDGGYFELGDMQLGFKADFSRPEGTDAEAPYAVSFPEFAVYRAAVKLSDEYRFSVSGEDINQKIAGREYRRKAGIANGEFTAEASSRSLVAEISAASAHAAEADLREMYKNRLFIQRNRPIPSVAQLQSEAGKPLATAQEYLDRGTDMAERGMYEPAVREYTSALALEPDNELALANRGNANLQLKRLSEARADLRRALELDPANGYALSILGGVAVLEGDNTAAVDLLTKAIELEDGEWERGQRANAYLALGDARRAALDLVAISRLNPTATNHFTTRANDLVNKHRMDDARTLARNALESHAGPGDGALIAARIYYLTGDDTLGLDTAREGARKTPSTQMYLLLSELEEENGGRLAALENALKLDPQSTPALQRLMDLQWRMDRIDDALSTAKRLGTPGLPMQGLLLAKKGDLENSRKAFAALRAISRNDKELSALCDWESTAGLLPDALQDCEAALAINRACAFCLEGKGIVLVRMDRNSEALAVFEQAVALEPGRPDALFGRGISKKRLGREAEGNADIDAALAKDGRVQARFAAAGLKR